MGSGGDQTPWTCKSCREKHLKCDIDGDYKPEPGSDLPACSRCASSGKQCIRSTRNLRFKFHSQRPDNCQRWVKLPPRLHFVNETDELRALYSLQTGNPFYPYVISSPPTYDDNGNSGRPKHIEGNIPSTSDVLSPVAPSPAHQVTTDRRAYTFVPVNSRLGLANPSVSSTTVAFPLRRPGEVRLMKYYIEYMCTWFDLCDVQRHFAVEVPRRAISCPTLLNAVFALCSRHLSMNEQFDQYASDRYHQQCLRELSTIYTDSSVLLDDDLLAATILLRTLEEMDVPLIGADHEGHLHGIQLFVNTPSRASSLRQASFWIGLRQEITMAFMSQRPIRIKLDQDFVDRSFSPASDDTWANRIVIHCGEVVNFCFGETDQNTPEHQRLKDYDDGWLRARPLSFLPLAYCEPDATSGEVFPQIHYLNHAVVIGNAHATFARALLMCYDPTIPKIGPHQKQAQQRLNDEIRCQIRELCGIALSNRATIPAMFTASMGVTMCGDRFADEAARHALLDVLVKTETTYSWPTGAARVHLRKAWGWTAHVA